MLSTSSETNDETERATAEWRLRLRVLLSEYRTVVIVTLVVALALGGWVSYGAYATPNEETTRDRDRVWTATGGFSHGATVTESNPIHRDGARLENESLYYTAVTPTVDGEFVGGYESRTDGDVRIRLTVDLVYRAVDAEDDAVYWSERERLASATDENVSPDETVTAAFALNVSEVVTTIDEIERDLGASPGETEIALVLEREIDGTIAGRERSTADDYRVDITVEDGTYRLDDEASYDEPHTESETETVPGSVGPARAVGGPLLVLLGGGGLVGLAVVSRHGPDPTAAERAWLAYRDHVDRFADVIVTVSLPDAALEGPRAELETLAALAEFGIDVGAPIAFDPERERYVVRDDGIVYVFEPPARPSATETESSTTGSSGANRPDADTGADDLLAYAEGRHSDHPESAPSGGDSDSAGGSNSNEQGESGSSGRG